MMEALRLGQLQNWEWGKEALHPLRQQANPWGPGPDSLSSSIHQEGRQLEVPPWTVRVWAAAVLPEVAAIPKAQACTKGKFSCTCTALRRPRRSSRFPRGGARAFTPGSIDHYIYNCKTDPGQLRGITVVANAPNWMPNMITVARPGCTALSVFRFAPGEVSGDWPWSESQLVHFRYLDCEDQRATFERRLAVERIQPPHSISNAFFFFTADRDSRQ